MTMMSSSSGVTRAPRPSSLADVLDLILDKGLVIDAYVRVSAVGIEVLTIDARIVIASVDTYLHYAEAVNRLDLRTTEVEGISGFMGNGAGSQGSQDSDGSSQSSRGNGGGRSQSGRRREVGAGGSSARGERQAGQAGQDDDRQKNRRQEGRRRQDDGGDEDGEQRGLVARLGERGKWD